MIAHLEGDKKLVHQLVEEMWSGPGAASVRDVQYHRIPTVTPSMEFEIRR